MDYNKISIILSSLSFAVSVLLSINQMRLNNESRFKLSAIISKEYSSFIDPILTDDGNEKSLLIFLKLVNRSATSIEISNMQNKIKWNKFNCLPDSKCIKKQYKIKFMDHSEIINPKNIGLEFPLKIEPYSSIEGIVVFPYATDSEKVKIEIQTPRKNIRKSLKLPSKRIE